VFYGTPILVRDFPYKLMNFNKLQVKKELSPSYILFIKLNNFNIVSKSVIYFVASIFCKIKK